MSYQVKLAETIVAAFSTLEAAEAWAKAELDAKDKPTFEEVAEVAE